jgi:hypothetical protein
MRKFKPVEKKENHRVKVKLINFDKIRAFKKYKTI